MNERRNNSRLRSFLQGRIYFNQRRSSLDCLVRDLSDDGAKLKVSNSVALPEFVELHIPNKNVTLPAKIQWRAGDEIGIAFNMESAAPSIVPEAPAAPATDLAGRVHRLETEVAALQRRLNELREELSKQRSSAI